VGSVASGTALFLGLAGFSLTCSAGFRVAETTLNVRFLFLGRNTPYEPLKSLPLRVFLSPFPMVSFRYFPVGVWEVNIRKNGGASNPLILWG
jgi:hypothetical protein